MSERFDVIIVGGRCAGSPLATILAQAGLKVAVIEQATFPQETLSSHLMEADGLTFLMRLGVGEEVKATGIRFLTQTDIRLNDFRVLAPFPLRFDDLGGAGFLRRHLLDEILANAAIKAGADVRFGTKVVEVLWDRRRVSGVRVISDGIESDLHARLVVGADGRRSTVAYMCASRKYNIEPSERSYYFTFFEGADPACTDTFYFHRWGDRMFWGGAADNGLFLVGVSPEQHERDYFRTETERGLLAHLRSCEPMAYALRDAKIATKISGIRSFEGYFREPSGPGWLLVGDAGHFKDPALGRGIGDAFLQVDAVAPVIINGLNGSDVYLDSLLRRWGKWRHEKFEGHYWLATNLGRSGAIPPMIPQVVRRLAERGEIDRFYELFHHRGRYDDVFPLRELGTETVRLLASPKSGRHPRGLSAGRGPLVKRAPLLKDAATLLARESKRRWRSRRLALAPSDLTPAPKRTKHLSSPPEVGP